MKLFQASKRRATEGNFLVMALVAATVMGTTLAAYLNLANHHNLSMVRSYSWNAVIPFAEAGIEEALTHMNTMGNQANWGTNGWTYSNGTFQVSRTLGDGSYTVSITSNSTPTVTSIGFLTMPVTDKVLSRTVQVTSANLGTGIRGLTAIGGIELVGNIILDSFDSTDPLKSVNGLYDASVRQDNGYVGSVNGSITGGGGIVYGSAATGPTGSASSAGTIGDASWHAGGGSGIQPGHYANDLNVSFPDATAPFTSGTGILGTGGTGYLTNYNVSTSSATSYNYPTNASGAVTTNIVTLTTNAVPSLLPASGLTTNAMVSSGTATTSASLPAGLPPSTTIVTNTSAQSLGPYGSAGAALAAAGTQGVDYTTASTSRRRSGPPSGRGWYVNYNAIVSYTYTPPGGTNYTYSYNVYEYGYNTSTTNATTSSDSYDYILGTDDYSASSVSMSGQDKILVTGNARLYISNGFSMAGQSEIVIAPGGSLTVYTAGNVQLAGNGVMNYTQNALNYQVIGLPSCTSIRMTGNAAFTGVIYAPSAHLHLGGGGNTSYDCVGAAVVGSVKLNGHFNFHYDEMLGNEDYGYEWLITGWREI